jgi:diguanylate cyclase (GGDEF)-like protein/PAS domain S-box-containing protein
LKGAADDSHVALELLSQDQPSFVAGTNAGGPKMGPSMNPATADLFTLIADGAQASLLCDVQGRIVQVGGTPELVFGFSSESLHQQSLLSAIPQPKHAEIVAGFNEALTGTSAAPISYEAAGPWGGLLKVTVHIVPLIAENQLRGVMVQAAERSLPDVAEAIYGSNPQRGLDLASLAPFPVFFLDGRGQCTFINDRWGALTGQPSLQALGVGFFARLTEVNAKAFRATAVSAHINKSGWRLQFEVLTANDQPWLVDAAAASVPDTNGTVIGYVGAFLPFSTKLSGLPAMQTAPAASVPESAPASASVASQPSAAPLQAQPQQAAPTEQSIGPTEQAQPVFAQAQPVPAHAAQVQAAQAQAEPVQAQEYAPPAEAPVQPTQPQSAAPSWSTEAVANPAPSVESNPMFVDTSAMNATPAAKQMWTPPVLQEGFTKPELLVTPERPEPAADALPVLEPGIDKVTGLSNRLLFAQNVTSTVNRMQADSLTVAVSFVELHGLTDMRREVGPRVANDYLFLLARRLEATIRSIEMAGRLEGDLFGVLSINWLFAEDLPVLANRLMSKLREPLSAKDGGELTVAMDLGMAVSRPGEHVNDIFRRAWEALQTSRQNPNENFYIDYNVEQS